MKLNRHDLTHSTGVLLAFSILAGCSASHGPATSADPDAGSSPGFADAGVVDAAEDIPPRVDAVIVRPPIGMAPVTCEIYSPGDGLECDAEVFGECNREIAGVPCCETNLTCVDGEVITNTFCSDDCAQACELVADPTGCALYGCEWFVPGCSRGGGAVGYSTMGCISPRGRACVDSSTCEPGEQCQSFWVDPCVDEPCDACGGEAKFCWTETLSDG